MHFIILFKYGSLLKHCYENKTLTMTSLIVSKGDAYLGRYFGTLR